MLKICHIIFSFEVGGAESLLVDIANQQARDNNSVVIMIINNQVNNQLLNSLEKSILVYCLKRKPRSKNGFFLVKLWRRILNVNPDAIHCHNHSIIKLIPFWRSKTLLTVHDLRYPVTNLKKYRRVIAISKSVKNDLFVRGSVDSTLVYNGIVPSGMLMRDKIYNNEDQPFKILQISRLIHEKKGQDVLLKAIKLLVFEKKVTNIQVDLIGDGPSYSFLKDIICDYNLDSYVKLLGAKNRDYVYANLRNYNLLVHPAIYEGFGLTVAEAMVAKVPVLVSNIDGPMEIISNGKFGYSFKSADPLDLAKMISRIIDIYDTEDLKNVLNNAYKQAVENFTIEKTVKNYNIIYTMNAKGMTA